MIELYLLEQAIRTERILLDRESARRAASVAWLPSVAPALPGLRRRLALLLLVLADWLAPRPVLSHAHLPGRPHLNGTLHHA